ncbi:co-chaperone protein daf-41 [Ctenocephalides felis]|uniref:co-chaperone protein daf-41 n=1 Tax=Ctenocephalides felis TaxID=7515 RepID=UPI000E6E49EF|nr:co-chaperone protein daf-41 [Ctenocephalides felis]
MTTDTALPPPSVMWAQRPSVILLTVNLEDCSEPEIKFTPTTFYFKGTGGVDKKTYEVNIELYKAIDPENSRFCNRGRCIEVVLTKTTEEGGYWPTLTADKKKHHWLKVDFNKWQDEDDSGDEGLGGFGGGMGGGGDLEDMMRQMGGLGGMGGDKPSFDDLDGDDEDSDDGEMPDLA